MKNLLIVFILLCLTNCENKKLDINNNEKYFEKNRLSELSLDNISGFWENDTLSHFVNDFNNYVGYLDGIGLKDNEKGISVAVFESKEKAINCMESKINSVACIIEKGNSVEIEGIWWFSDCIPKAVFKNQWNTIIEVYYYHKDFEDIKPVLFNTANEISKRVDNLSK